MSKASLVARAQAALLSGPIVPAAERCVANTQRPLKSEIFTELRKDLLGAYLARTPTSVRAILALEERFGTLVNDHVALRSFVDSKGCSGLRFLTSIFAEFGYTTQPSITIPGMPVNAHWLEPPETTDWPKIFISELRVAELPSKEARDIVYRHVDGYYENKVGELFTVLDTPPWNPTAGEEAAIRAIGGSATEYAAWTLTHGHRWNHITILANTLGGVSLQELNSLFVKDLGIEMNKAGGDGMTQGSLKAKLEQSSTVADPVRHTFSDGTARGVPCAFLELIYRHEGFRAFLGDNAKGIFDSTNSR